MFGLYTTTPPFSAPKLLAYLAAMAAIAYLSLNPLTTGPAQPAQLAPESDGAPNFDIIRFAKPREEIEDQWVQIGIPWLLRNEGVAAQPAPAPPHQLVIDLIWQNQKLGRIIEKTESITPNFTRLLLAFVPDNIALVQRLAAPIDTSLSPLGLMQATLDEHLRASLDDDEFDLNILKPGSFAALLPRFLGAGNDTRHPARDDAPLEAIDPAAAAIENAYRAEAAQAGANAGDL